MNDALIITLIVSGIAFGTPLLLGALGELLAERAGVMNLGLEGMFLVGAVSAFWVSQSVDGSSSKALLLASLVAILAGTAMSLIHAYVTITLRANQIVSGLALTIVGGSVGLSSYLAEIGKLGGLSGTHQFRGLDVFGLGDLPIVGPIIFDQDALVYVSWALVILTAIYLYRTRFGLHLRAVGEEPKASDAMGISVVGYRYAHTLAGGGFAGLAGAYYSLALTPTWTNGLTAGAGWIALALTIFAFWNPWFVLVGAYLFGIVSSLGFILQARGVDLPPELFGSLPYVMTIVVLVFVSSALARRRLGAPAALGEPYVREEQ
jgi:simple sugar transport system permease protein